MRSINLLSAIALLWLILSGCGNDSGTPTPVVTSINPTSAKYNASLTITGKNFANSVTGNTVKINGTTAPVSQASTTELVVTVPKGASTGTVTVETEGGVSEGPTFTYIYTVTVSTFVGSGSSGYQDATGTNASFNFPTGLAFDSQDNLFVTDRFNHRIRKVTPAGFVTTVAGSGTSGTVDGNGTASQFTSPWGIFRDNAGNFYITCYGSIRKMTPGYDVTTIAGSSNNAGYTDGPVASAQFYQVSGIVKGSTGDLFVVDGGNAVIRKISSGLVSTIAGDGSFATLNPISVTIDSQDNLYFTDLVGFQVKKISSSGTIMVVAGTGDSGYADGDITQAKFQTPRGITLDLDMNLLVADYYALRKISSGVTTTITGGATGGFVNGDGSIAKFDLINCVAINSKGEIYLGERNNYAIRKIVLE